MSRRCYRILALDARVTVRKVLRRVGNGDASARMPVTTEPGVLILTSFLETGRGQ